jgi:hypothetical protein
MRIGARQAQPFPLRDVTTTCSKCAALVGAPAAVDPHGELVLSAVFRRLNGKLEWYRCGNCHARWERLVCKFVFAAQREFWLKTTL